MDMEQSQQFLSNELIWTATCDCNISDLNNSNEPVTKKKKLCVKTNNSENINVNEYMKADHISCFNGDDIEGNSRSLTASSIIRENHIGKIVDYCDSEPDIQQYSINLFGQLSQEQEKVDNQMKTSSVVLQQNREITLSSTSGGNFNNYDINMAINGKISDNLHQYGIDSSTLINMEHMTEVNKYQTTLLKGGDNSIPCAGPTNNASHYGTSFEVENLYRFQYVLCAATSVATKNKEDHLTYLNQGQSYEIKLKKLGDLSHIKGKIFKSIIKVLFHDRRLQCMEQQQITTWKISRPGDRILEIDLPLSYGITHYLQDPNWVNVVAILWDPTKDVGIYVKVNCISSEFTAKKHGGEKGVPFRIQIETYSLEKQPKILHTASCQVKVFKLKGADRKHKQDRDKMRKMTPTERKNYKDSCECTIFTDMNTNNDDSDPLSPSVTNSSTNSPRNTNLDGSQTPTLDAHNSSFLDYIEPQTPYQNYNASRLRGSTISDVQNWLKFNHFDSYLSQFEKFTVRDMLLLSKDDLIQICGEADGIRIYNALIIKTKLTIYLTTNKESNVYYPLYMKTFNTEELINKVASICLLKTNQIQNSYVLGPHNSHITITDELIENIKDQSLYLVEILTDNQMYNVVLKPMNSD